MTEFCIRGGSVSLLNSVHDLLRSGHFGPIWEKKENGRFGAGGLAADSRTTLKQLPKKLVLNVIFFKNVHLRELF